MRAATHSFFAPPDLWVRAQDLGLLATHRHTEGGEPDAWGFYHYDRICLRDILAGNPRGCEYEVVAQLRLPLQKIRAIAEWREKMVQVKKELEGLRWYQWAQRRRLRVRLQFLVYLLVQDTGGIEVKEGK